MRVPLTPCGRTGHPHDDRRGAGHYRPRTRGGYIDGDFCQRGKTFNFSVIYGGGVRTICRQQRCSQDHAKLLKRRYYDAYPEVKRLQNRIEYALHDRGYIQTMWGRRMRVDPRDAFKAVNYLVQGTAAEILKDALIACHGRDCRWWH